MEKSFSFFENRRKVIEEKLELLLELDRILRDQGDAPYVLERHEQMARRITEAKDEIELLTEEQKIVEAERRQLLGVGVGASRPRKSRKI